MKIMAMERLNLPDYPFRIRSADGKEEIFDEIRKKFVALTPEEWVRQHFIRFLSGEKGIPVSHISVEAPLKVYGLSKRADILVSDQKGRPVMLTECKAPHVAVDQQAFDQIARYNMTIKADYLVVTNGLKHYCCILDHSSASYRFLKDIPDYGQLTGRQS